MSEQQDKRIEEEIKSKGLTYPRVEKERIDELMAQVTYDCHVVPGTTTTVITAMLPIGHINFSLCTEIMACVDPRNFNAELGKKYGIEKAEISARSKLWELEGYALALICGRTEQKLPEDEYGLLEILGAYGAENALAEINSKFDNFCDAYMKSREDVRQSAFVEWKCCLLQMIISSNRDGKKLEEEIERFLEAGPGSEGLSFGEAVELAKQGKRIARKGWNGANMFAYIVEGDSYPAKMEAIKGVFEKDNVPYRSYWALKTAQDDVATWTPSGSDTLANDWLIVE